MSFLWYAFLSNVFHSVHTEKIIFIQYFIIFSLSLQSCQRNAISFKTISQWTAGPLEQSLKNLLEFTLSEGKKSQEKFHCRDQLQSMEESVMKLSAFRKTQSLGSKSPSFLHSIDYQKNETFLLPETSIEMQAANEREELKRWSEDGNAILQ